MFLLANGIEFVGPDDPAIADLVVSVLAGESTEADVIAAVRAHMALPPRA